MKGDVKVRCFRDIRDAVFGLPQPKWKNTSRKLSYKFSRLELVVLCSALVKILWSLVTQSILPSLIDAVGIERVLRAETCLCHTSQGFPEDPSVCVSSFLLGILTQIKEAMKRALLKFSSAETPSESCQKVTMAGKRPLIDHLTASSTNTIIAEIIPLCCPDISHNSEQPLGFQQVLSSIIKAMRHVHKVQTSFSLTDDERSSSSEGDEKNLLSKRIRIKAKHIVSGILLEAGEEISSMGSPHHGPLDEITVTPPSIRVHPTTSKITKTLLKSFTKQPSSNQTWTEPTVSRNTLLPVACKIYRSVQKNVFSFLLKVQTSTEEKGPPAEHERQKVVPGNGEDLLSKPASEGPGVSLVDAVQATDASSSSARNEEQLRLEVCTDEVIRQISAMYRTRTLHLTPDLIESTCAHLVSDVLVQNLQIPNTEKEKPRNTWRSSSSHETLRNPSCPVKMYLDSEALEMTRSFFEDLKDRFAETGTETQSGIVSASIRGGFHHANIFTPFRLYGRVRDKIADIFFTVNEDRWTSGSTRAPSGKDETHLQAVRTEDAGFFPGFTRRQTAAANSSVNQLKSLLSNDSGTKHREQAVANAISTVLRNMTGMETLIRRFSEAEEPCCSMFGTCGFSMLVLSFVPELVTRLASYFSNTGFLQLAVQTEFCRTETTSGDEDGGTAALNELTGALKDLVEEFTAKLTAPTRRTRKTKTQEEPNARKQESQIITSDDDVSCPSAQGSAERKKKRKRRKITIHTRALKQNKTLKNGVCPAERPELKEDEVSLRERVAAALRRKIATFFGPMRSCVSPGV